MNNKWQKYVSINNLKNKLSKQAEQKQNHRYGELVDGNQMGGETGEIGEKVKGLKSTI